jgi:hypothetical protein
MRASTELKQPGLLGGSGPLRCTVDLRMNRALGEPGVCRTSKHFGALALLKSYVTSVHVMVAIPGSKFSGCLSPTGEHSRADLDLFH